MPVSIPEVGVCRHTQEQANKFSEDREKSEHKWEVGLDILEDSLFFMISWVVPRFLVSLVYHLFFFFFCQIIYSVTTPGRRQLVLKTPSTHPLVGYVYDPIQCQHYRILAPDDVNLTHWSQKVQETYSLSSGNIMGRLFPNFFLNFLVLIK